MRIKELNYKFFLIFFIACFFGKAKASPVFSFASSKKVDSIRNYFYLFQDSTGKMSPSEVRKNGKFIKYEKTIPYFEQSDNVLWISFSIKNISAVSDIFFLIQSANTSVIEVYKDSAGELKKVQLTGNNIPVKGRLSYLPDYVINLYIAPGSTEIYYLRVKSDHPIFLPMAVGVKSDIEHLLHNQLYIICLYLGIILTIFFYNLFLFISTLDKDYFYYILFIFFLAFAQITYAGYSYIYLWKQLPAINAFAVPVTTCLGAIATGLFTVNFLRTKLYTPKIHKIFIVIILLFAVAAIFSFSGYNGISYSIIAVTKLAAAFLSIVASVYIGRKGYRPAYFFFISFLAFSVGLIIFSLRNVNIIPDNNFTANLLYIGTAIETILLSFALADKINSLRIEKEASQTYALKIAQENELLIKEQNIVLEQKVAKRTDELQNTNNQLNKTLGDLKDAQTQLVEAEKMASLGQLTAGIAHEINNPINFVKSNIKPLRLDIEDLFEVIDQYNLLHTTGKDKFEQELESVYAKQEALGMDFVRNEIKQLIKGIEDGAERTAEIVRGLRTFSRLDESELKIASVHDGIESTIVLIRNTMPNNITIKKEFNAVGNIECFPGKLNQVFMNVLNNAIQAITQKKDIETGDQVLITTSDTADNNIIIKIKDTGIGMSEQVMHRIYEPFFTTKAVGDGTGLGMAIVFKIIEEHAGKIEVFSQQGKGSEFIITLPYIHPKEKDLII